MIKKTKLIPCISNCITQWLNPIELTQTKKLKFVKGFKYQVTEDFVIFVGRYYKPKFNVINEFFEFYKDGTLLIKRGFAWDGPSGPTIDTKNAHIPAIVHDVLYRMIRKGLLPLSFKPIADEIFYKLLRKYGMFIIRAYLWYLGVVWFGLESCTKPKRVIQITERD